MRAFARLFILIIPILYGPYMAEFADSTDLAFAVFFSMTTSLALEGLFRIRLDLEDPFASLDSSPDAVDVDMELSDLVADLKIFSDEPSLATAVKIELQADGEKLHP